MTALDLLAALLALFMLWRHVPGATTLLSPRPGGPTRARAVFSLLTCLAAIGVLVMAARAGLLAASRTPGAHP